MVLCFVIRQYFKQWFLEITKTNDFGMFSAYVQREQTSILTVLKRCTCFSMCSIFKKKIKKIRRSLSARTYRFQLRIHSMTIEIRIS